MSTEQWEEVSSRARAILNYGIAKKEWLEQNRLARFIAAVPYLAGCRKARETSFVHLLTYLVAMDEAARDVFFHSPEDDGDVYSRLAPLLSFEGGDAKILACYRDLLALCMVSSYRNDAATDRQIGKYNPVDSGVWDAEALSRDLIASIEGTITPEISAFYAVDEALKGYWGS